MLHVVFPPIDSFLQLLHLLCHDLIFDEQKKREILLLLMIMLMIESIVFRILSFFFFFEYHFRQQNFFLHLTFTNISRWNIYIHFCLFHHSSTNQFILALDSHAHYFFCLFISICFEFSSDRWWWWWRKPGNCHTNIHAQWWIFELFVFFLPSIF